jgi:hypothetical protein
LIVRKFPLQHLDPISLLGHNDSNVRQIEREIPCASPCVTAR